MKSKTYIITIVILGACITGAASAQDLKEGQNTGH